MTLSEAEELLKHYFETPCGECVGEPERCADCLEHNEVILELLQAKEIVEREGKGHFCLAPKAFIGEGNMPEEIAPLWEDNGNGYLNVCICGNCELPTLEKLAKDFRLNLHSKDKDGVIKPLFEILNNPKE